MSLNQLDPFQWRLPHLPTSKQAARSGMQVQQFFCMFDSSIFVVPSSIYAPHSKQMSPKFVLGEAIMLHCATGEIMSDLFRMLQLVPDCWFSLQLGEREKKNRGNCKWLGETVGIQPSFLHEKVGHAWTIMSFYLNSLILDISSLVSFPLPFLIDKELRYHFFVLRQAVAKAWSSLFLYGFRCILFFKSHSRHWRW